MEILTKYQDVVLGYLSSGVMKVGAALAFWIVGRYLIGMIGRLLQQLLQRQKVDPTLMRYLGNILNVALNIALVVSILGYCGVETTSFAALVAGVGIAVGAAWGGLLSNLAAGAFLIVLKPFKVGDFICAGGVTGTVKEIGLFATAIDTPDNVHTIVGNGKKGSAVGADWAGTQLNRPHGARIGPDGRLFVTDTENNRILIGPAP